MHARIEEPIINRDQLETKQIDTQAWAGVTGQDKYEMIIKSGPDALNKYAEGSSLIDCLPGDESLDWVMPDIEKKTIELQLN